ncbi:carotenoid biosynthesis protein [Nonomuraea sp. NPDC050328]|uniref:carotenoid biosynthesis protein n=1 Tax=Nonomuraea sp. NPDC050328 TaxID=3364361 RepID=UPI0037BB8065
MTKLGTAFLAAMVTLQVVSGLSERPAAYTTAIVVALATCATCFAAATAGPRRAVAALAGAVAVGYMAELVGVTTGFPFGAYHYTGLLQPQVAGVPVAVALAWGGMGLAAHAVAAAIAAPGWRRIAAGAVALTAWDLFLDPQMLRMGLWVWEHPGPYRDVPLTNFAGWLLVSALLMLLFERLLPTPGRALVTLYTAMAVMETVAFAAVFRPTDPLVAVTGGLAMGGLATAAWIRMRDPNRSPAWQK